MGTDTERRRMCQTDIETDGDRQRERQKIRERNGVRENQK